MLTFDDASLARLVIASSAVPRRRRGLWLRRLAERAENGEPAQDAAVPPCVAAYRKRERLRQRKRRKLARAGFRIARVPIGPREEQFLRDAECLRDWDEAQDADALGNAVRILFEQLLAKST
jgi:hypothetical protein